jgi:FAD/FMN-containing dehydrogenase
MQLIHPGEPGFEQLRKPAISRYDQIRPQALARCETGKDVAHALRLARQHGLPVAVRSGGHSFAGQSSTTGILIDVSPMASVRVTGRRVTTGAGTRLGGLYEALADHGRTVPTGCGTSVGIAGLTLGGGLGLLGRRHGLTCDQLISARVVLADGTIVDCDEQRDADLFWALRGGGPETLGVVIELEFDTIPVPSVTRFNLEWAHEHVANVILAWQMWTPHTPPEMYASLLVTAGRHPRVHVFGTLIGKQRDATRMLSVLIAQAGSYPSQASSAQLPYLAAKHDIAQADDRMRDVASAEATLIKSEFFPGPLPRETVDALVTSLHADRAPGEYRELDFSPWGGAYNQVPPDATAFPHRDAAFLLKHASNMETGWRARSWQLTHPQGTGGVYPNFPDPELGEAAPLAYYAGNFPKLRRVKAACDPDGMFAGAYGVASSTCSSRPARPVSSP